MQPRKPNKYCTAEDIEPYIVQYASRHDNSVDLPQAFKLLSDQHSHLKIGWRKFEDLGLQIVSKMGYTIAARTKPAKQFLLPQQTTRAPPNAAVYNAPRPPPEFEALSTSLRYADVGGLDSQKGQLEELIRLPIVAAELFKSAGASPIRGILVHGPSGCGKSLLAEATAGEFSELGLNFFSVSAVDMLPSTQKLTGQSESKLRALFKAAATSSPSLIVVDDIDVIARRKEGASVKLIAQLGQSLDSCFADEEHLVFVIATTSHLENIDISLRRPGRFGREVSIGLPDYEQRLAVLNVAVSRVNCDTDVRLDIIAREAEGFVGADITALIQEAALGSVKRALGRGWKEAVVGQDDFLNAIPRVQPTMRREGFTTLPPASFADIGGLDEVKQELQIAIVDPILRPEIFQMYGHRPSSGVLLFGPPGCGKTLLARAVAREANRAAFISIKGPELLNKFLGESESAVRSVFRRARDSSPCIVFFDEIDAICPRRSDDSSNQATSRVVNQLLTEMDGVVDRSKVFVIGATNRPGLVDEAMLRPGRLDKMIEVPLPDLRGRTEILMKLVERIGKCDGINCDEIARQCDRASGADLDALTCEAIQAAIRESADDIWVPVAQRHFESAIEKWKVTRGRKDKLWASG
jgi:ribosome biogenesis ATPase